MRKSKSSPEKIAHILIPCIIQDTEDIESLGTFPNVRNIIAAMGSVDQALIDTVVMKSRKTDIGVGSGGIGGIGGIGDSSSRNSRAIEFDSVDFVDDRMKLDDASFELKIFDRICEKSNGIHWFKRLIQVREFREREGRLPRQSDGPLGIWCNKQRYNKKKGKLSPDRIKSLEEKILGWYWEQDLDGDWEDTRQAVYEFAVKEGRLPYKSEGPLGNWHFRQKQNKKKGKLSPDQIKSLEEIPGWYWSDRDLDERWEDTRQAVSEFREREGRLPGSKEGPLGMWCSNQRQNKKKGKLSPDRIKSLEEIPGWIWDLDDKWENTRQAVNEFAVKEGRLPRENEGPVGMWCSRQRQNKKKGKLSPDRIKSLEEKILGWYWEQGLDDEWKTNLQAAIEFREREGRLPRHSDGPVGMWCSRQRYNKKKGKLSPDRIKSLEEKILGWYWEQDLDDEWKTNLQAAIEFREREGRLPRESDGPVGRWCKTQRYNKRKGKLSPDRIKSLEEKILGWYWEQDLDGEWKTNLQAAIEFVQKKGRLPRVSDGPVGIWCKTQRKNKKKGKLSPYRIKSLEEKILGWYWERDLDGEWEDKRQAVYEFWEREGRLPLWSDGPLGRWCSRQRRNKKKGKLSSYRIKSLEEIPGWYWSK